MFARSVEFRDSGHFIGNQVKCFLLKGRGHPRKGPDGSKAVRECHLLSGTHIPSVLSANLPSFSKKIDEVAYLVYLNTVKHVGPIPLHESSLCVDTEDNAIHLDGYEQRRWRHDVSPSEVLLILLLIFHFNSFEIKSISTRCKSRYRISAHYF